MVKEFVLQNLPFGILDRRVIVRKHGIINRLLRDLSGTVFISLLGKNSKLFIIPFKINGAGNYRAPFILLSEIYSNHYN
jgi:hypothetical protein